MMINNNNYNITVYDNNDDYIDDISRNEIMIEIFSIVIFICVLVP